MSEPDTAKPRHRRVSSPYSEPTRSPSPFSVSRSIITLQTSAESESSVIEVKEESHDLILSDDDENWTLQMEDDEEGEEEVIEVKKITDFVRESFKKEGKFLII